MSHSSMQSCTAMHRVWTEERREIKLALLAMGRTHLDDQDGFKVEEAEQEGLRSVLVLVQKVAHDNQR